jgi:DNA-directed RNA polymerase specialized sigma24 family protein
MKRRRQRIVPPPGPGFYGPCEISEAISEEEKAGRPVAPLIELRPSGPPLEISEAISEEEKAGRPIAPPLPLAPPPDPALPPVSPLPTVAGGPSPENDTDRLEREAVFAATEHLPPTMRAVFEMAYRGLSRTEIAAATGEPEQVIANRLFTARKKLAEVLRALDAEAARAGERSQ